MRYPLRSGGLFYWYFEPIGVAAETPLLLWLQGGPGASSCLGRVTGIDSSCGTGGQAVDEDDEDEDDFDDDEEEEEEDVLYCTVCLGRACRFLGGSGMGRSDGTVCLLTGVWSDSVVSC